MRVKQLWSFIPAPAMLKLVWERITFNRLTTIYLIFSVLHCAVQVGFQTRAYIINADAAMFLHGILKQGSAENNQFPVLGKDFRLGMCSVAPNVTDPIAAGYCDVIWDGRPRSNWIGNQPSATIPPSFASAAAASSDPTITSGNLNALSPQSSSSGTRTSTVFVRPTPTPSPAAVNNLSTGDDEDNGRLNLVDIIEAFQRRDTYDISHAQVKAVNANGSVQVQVSGMGYDAPAVLDRSCLWALNYPVTILHNTKREDISFICFQIWVLGMSIVALLNESIPHILASLLTHIMATGWAVFQIFHTANFRSTFNKVISNGACNKTNLLPHYWQDRANAEIPAVALNGVALIISAFLTYRLVKLFGWQTFKRVGASLTINRLYKIVLTLSIVIQLAAFFIVVAVALWVDQLFNTALGRQATLLKAYQGVSITVLVLVIPWLALGWIAVRRELRLIMFCFLALGVLYLTGWGVMFFSDTFRWEFITWRFFSIMSTISVGLTFISLVLGVTSRFNFGKGLPRYLAAQEELPGEDFEPYHPGSSDPEKVAFPSSDSPIPTYSSTFGKGDEVPIPTKMFAPARVGPRFFNRSLEPFETPSGSEATLSSGAPSEYGQSLYRSNTIGSQHSYSSSQSSSNSPGQKGNRWVIE